MNERMCFVAAYLDGGESVSALCREFGISRKTGHKWLARYGQAGCAGLEERSRAPLGNPRAMDEAAIKAVVDVRLRYPTWGPDKVKAYLERTAPERVWPSASSMGRQFVRAGLVRPSRRRVRTPGMGHPLTSCKAANDIWCPVDLGYFKGWFLTGDGIQVDPFTMTDRYSRYLLCLEAVGRCDEAHVWPWFEAAFRAFGLPLVVLSDN
ncbi:MAG: helix-turn-helix domain-containing protein, partial [Alphaproteobacteria bacterium]